MIDAGRTVIAGHLLPRPLQDVPAVDLVIERVEPSPGIGLGRPVEAALQFWTLMLAGLALRALTGLSLAQPQTK